ncbi:MAG: type II secretion system F family protein [Candidatus Methanoperedens sp.]|nr:type II secretion system F family protein [Candidatus Methanoperedens sp.]
MNFSQFSISRFGNFVKRHDRYLGMRKKLRSAHLFRPYEEYVSEAILFSLIAAALGLLLGILIGLIIITQVKLPTLVVYDPALAEIFSILAPFKYFNIVAIISVLFFILIGGMVYTIFMIYPSFQASIRKVNIDTQLPHAVMYMYALSRGETNIIEIIRSVAELPNIYGEISKEFAMILRDMELLGIDFMTALRNVQSETPSKDLHQFLGNLITLIDNGGDITDFFSMQIDNYRIQAKSTHTLFLDLLGMIAEGYVTGFVAGPLFLIIVAVTLGSMKGSMTGLLLGMTFGILPFGSIGFIFLIDLMLPKDEQIIGRMDLRKLKEFVGIRKVEMEQNSEKKLFDEYEKSKKRIRIETIIKDPLHAFFEEPGLSLYITVPVSILILLLVIISNPAALFGGYVTASQYLTNYILLSILAMLIPYIVFYEKRSRKLWKIEDTIPQFLRHLSIINETGLSLAESLRIMLRTDKGPLRTHIENMYTDITWGSSTTHAFVRFANNVRINMLSRVVALVTKASESSGDIRQVLDIAATDTNMNLQLKKDKSTNMLIYLIIIYMAFLVFLYVVYSLTATFLPPMAKGAAAGGGAFIRNFDLEFYKVYFYHTALIQAFFSGMVAGVMGEGNFRSGFKHSVILMVIAFLLFNFLV